MISLWMFCLLLLGVLGLFGIGLRIHGWAMWRSWFALAAAATAGKAFPDPALWVLFDLTAAIVVIIPPRAGFQKAIACLFAAMMLFELGWLPSARLNSDVVVSVGFWCGWLQLAVLLTWGIDEQYGLHHIRDWLVGPRMAHYAVDQP